MYLVRYHDSPTDINNYEFIYRIHPNADEGFIIEKTIYQSLAFYMCNVDTIFLATHSSILDDIQVNKLYVVNTEDPDILETKTLQIALHRCFKKSRTTFVEQDKMLELLDSITRVDPFVSEADYLRRKVNSS